MTFMADEERIQDLIRQWERDPIWDLEETPGFEAHRDRLLDHRMETEKRWHAEYQTERLRRPTDPHHLLDRIEALERQVDKVLDQLHHLVERR